jgi:hypothetical protein
MTFPQTIKLRETFLLVGAVLGLHLVVVCRVGDFWHVAAEWFDNPDYLQLASIIQRWHFSGGELAHHFWGFPWAIALISKLFFPPPLVALVLISVLASIVVSMLTHRLYGGWVAAAFLFVLDYRWVNMSCEGGSEPLFMCLVYASFLAARSNRWNLAALLASLSTTVRPLGVFALLGFAVALAMRKNYRHLVLLALIGLVVGTLYVVPLWLIVGSPFSNFHGYRSDWGRSGSPITYPFGAWAASYHVARRQLRWPNVVLSAAWLPLGIAGTVMMWLPPYRERFSRFQPEAIFASLYFLFFISYTYGGVFGDFARFLIPAMPLMLYSLSDWIPRNRSFLWGGAVLSALFSAAAVVGFKNVFGFRLP